MGKCIISFLYSWIDTNTNHPLNSSSLKLLNSYETTLLLKPFLLIIQNLDYFFSRQFKGDIKMRIQKSHNKSYSGRMPQFSRSIGNRNRTLVMEINLSRGISIYRISLIKWGSRWRKKTGFFAVLLRQFYDQVNREEPLWKGFLRLSHPIRDTDLLLILPLWGLWSNRRSALTFMRD